MASLDMKTAFDVVKPSVAPKIFPLTGSLAGRNEGRERQRLLGELRCETEFRNSKMCSAMRLQCCGDAWQNMCFGMPRRSGRPGGVDLPLEEHFTTSICSEVK